MFDRYLTATYVEGGRAWPHVDCWGLVILARCELFGLPRLSDFGAVTRHTPVDMQRAYRAEVDRALVECRPGPGVIAAAMRGAVCIHVGLVVEKEGRLRVLEINPRSTPSLPLLEDFEARYLRVIYYRDRDLSVAP